MFKTIKKFYQENEQLVIFVVMIISIFLTNEMTKPGSQKVHAYINEGVIFHNSGKLILGAMLLVLIDSIKEFPIFFSGWMGSLWILRKFVHLRTIVLLLFFVSILLYMYYAGFYLYPWISPLIISVLSISFLYPMEKYKVSYYRQAFVLFLVIWALQFFDLNPYVQNTGYVQKEIVIHIYTIASSMGVQDILHMFTYLMALPLLFSAITTMLFFVMQQQRYLSLQSIKERNEQIQKLELKAIEHRVKEEMYELVHDLKTPLTTIQGLFSLLPYQFKHGVVDQKLFDNYTHRIDRSLHGLNNMISEILYKDKANEITIQELIDYIKPQISVTMKKDVLSYHVQNPKIVIKVNKIRMSRVIINLLENALYATKHIKNPKLKLAISDEMLNNSTGERGVLIEIIDNGIGVQKKLLPYIWEANISTKGHTGLGLPFVRKTVEFYEGWVSAHLNRKEGMTFTVFLPTKKGGNRDHE